MKYKTTKEDFEYFKKRCKHWIKFWSLAEFSFRVEHVLDDDDDGCLAWINRDAGAMAVCICLNKIWDGSKVTKSELDRSAFHEVSHTVLATLALLGKKRFVTVDEICREEEAVIRRMENVIWKRLK